MNQSNSDCKSAIKGILFDWNGVLIDDEPLHFEAFRMTLEEAGFTLTPTAYYQHCLGRRDGDGLRALIEAYGWSIPLQHCITAKKRWYRELANSQGVPFLPGARTLLTWLYGKVEMAIVTSSARQEVEMQLQLSGQEHFFNFLIAAEDVTYGKPDPEGYLAAAKKLRLSHAKCLVVEDSSRNLQGLTGYRFHIAGVRNNRQHEYPSGVHLITSLIDIQRLLTQTTQNLIEEY